MINYTNRLDSAIRRAAWAHEKQKQHRNGTDIPYVIHPFGVMTIASNFTDNEDTLIACLLHDILEDVRRDIYSEHDMKLEFGDSVLSIVKDITKDKSLRNWYEQSNAYLSHLEAVACDQAVLVCAADKLHNLLSTLVDYDTYGDNLWQRFTTKSAADQLWWYQSILSIVLKRSNNLRLNEMLSNQVNRLREIVIK